MKKNNAPIDSTQQAADRINQKRESDVNTPFLWYNINIITTDSRKGGYYGFSKLC